MRYSNLSLIATIVFGGLLVSLHFIKPELDPSWRFISEYAIGPWGWLMRLAFFAWAGAYLALYLALRGKLSTKMGKVGMISLLISVSGLIIAGLFTTDPVTSSTPTMEGQLHGLGGTLGIAIPVAAWCIGFSVIRICPAGASWVRWSTLLAVVGAIVSMVSLGVMLTASEGKVTPDVSVGIPTRFEVLGYCIWQLAVAWNIRVLPNPEEYHHLSQTNTGQASA